MIKFLISTFLIGKFIRKMIKNRLFLGIGGGELISDPTKLYQQIQLSMIGKPGDPTPMMIGKLTKLGNMFELCNFEDPDILRLFLCNPDVLKYTSDAMSYTL